MPNDIKQKLANAAMHPADTFTGGLDQGNDVFQALKGKYKDNYNAALGDNRWLDAIANRGKEILAGLGEKTTKWASDEIKGPDGFGSNDVKVGKGLEGLYQTTAKINPQAGIKETPRPEPGKGAGVSSDSEDGSFEDEAKRLMGIRMGK